MPNTSAVVMARRPKVEKESGTLVAASPWSKKEISHGPPIGAPVSLSTVSVKPKEPSGATSLFGSGRSDRIARPRVDDRVETGIMVLKPASFPGSCQDVLPSIAVLAETRPLSHNQKSGCCR